MIVVVDSITRKEAIELGHNEVEIKILLEHLLEWCNNEDIVADGGLGASSMM